MVSSQQLRPERRKQGGRESSVPPVEGRSNCYITVPSLQVAVPGVGLVSSRLATKHFYSSKEAVVTEEL